MRNRWQESSPVPGGSVRAARAPDRETAIYQCACVVSMGGTIALLLALLACSRAEENQRVVEADIALVGVEVLTMEDRQILHNQTVLIHDTGIAAMGEGAELNVPPQARVIEAQGRFLVPGLVDAHIHLRHADPTALKEYLRAGVTCAREMNGRPFLLAWRDRIEAGDLVGPRLQIAAPTLGNWSSPREGYPTPETATAGAEAVRSFHAEGYDWMKVYSFLPGEAFDGVVEEARRRGIPVGGHVPVEVGIRETIRSGLRSIEHLTEYVGSALEPAAAALDETDFRSLFGAGDVDWTQIDSLVEATVEAGVWNVPTLIWFDRHLPAPMAEEAWSDRELRAQGARNRREIVRRLHAVGALLAVGTDSDAGEQLPATAIHDEIEAMIEAGIAPEEVLRMATLGGATLLDVADETGTVSEGKRADLLLLPCDPRQDFTCLRQAELVIAGGRVLD